MYIYVHIFFFFFLGLNESESHLGDDSTTLEESRLRTELMSCNQTPSGNSDLATGDDDSGAPMRHSGIELSAEISPLDDQLLAVDENKPKEPVQRMELPESSLVAETNILFEMSCVEGTVTWATHPFQRAGDEDASTLILLELLVTAEPQIVSLK